MVLGYCPLRDNAVIEALMTPATIAIAYWSADALHKLLIAAIERLATGQTLIVEHDNFFEQYSVAQHSLFPHIDQTYQIVADLAELEEFKWLLGK